ncbi:MAG TPA: type IX secretion system membrane protein PorP/SprF [Cytophagaceae bacterium]
MRIIFKNWKKELLLILFILTGIASFGQQQGQYSQYMMNYFQINPGIAGTEDFLDLKLGYRMQWAGFDGGPRNYYVSGHLPLNRLHNKVLRGRKSKPHHAMGGIIQGQTLGLLRHNSAHMAYAYHIPLDRSTYLSMGATAGVKQITVDHDRMYWGDLQIDPAAMVDTRYKFDMGVGFWFYTPKYFAGISSMQILRNRLDFSESNNGNGVLDRHMYLTTGYKFKLDPDFFLIPSVLIKGTRSAYTADLNAKLRFHNPRYHTQFWGGTSYRHKDAVVLIAGMGIPLTKVRPNQKHGNKTMLDISYAYDITTSKLSNYSNGTHEITIGLRLPAGGSVISPSDFW